MTNIELIKYLKRFDENKKLSILVLDPKRRIRHIPKKIYVLKEEPCIIFETEETEGFGEGGEKC